MLDERFQGEDFAVRRLAAVRFEAGPTIDEPWSGQKAEQRVRQWATVGEELDFSRYRLAFAWFDSNEPKVLGSYKLPHHDVVGGRLVVNFRGVAAAMAALLGARGGVKLPASHRRRVYRHLANHYAQFDKEPPKFRQLRMSIDRAREIARTFWS